MSYTDDNAKVIDGWVKEGWEWAKEISHEDFLKAKRGEMGIFLTPTKDIPSSWLDNISGKKVLGLASGGGQQMPVLCALGANATVMDYSKEMLEKERIVSRREGYEIEIVRADMSKKFPFPDSSFDMIINPVSNIYIELLDPFWKECYRVLKPGGVLLAGLDNGWNYVLDEEENKANIKLPFNSRTNLEQRKAFLDEDSGYQFSHDINAQIGGQIGAGFTLKEIFEDSNNSGQMSKFNAPFYYVTKSIK